MKNQQSVTGVAHRAAMVVTIFIIAPEKHKIVTMS
jgi:hypothetical protein